MTETKLKSPEELQQEREEAVKKQREENEKLADAQGKGKAAETPMGPGDYSGTKYSPNSPMGEPPTEAQQKAKDADVHPSQQTEEQKKNAGKQSKPAEHHEEQRRAR